MNNRFGNMLLFAAIALLTACKEDVSQSVVPQDLTPETLGHYCQMNLLEHSGPKAQVFLEGFAAPLFFSQVRDAIAYARGPEQMAPIVAVFVNDMGAADATWEQPGKRNWISADKALYVVGADRPGGMGAPETIPFHDQEKAEEFSRAEGGQVLAYQDITDAMVLTPVEIDGDKDTGNSEYLDRLDALPHAHGG